MKGIFRGTIGEWKHKEFHVESDGVVIAHVYAVQSNPSCVDNDLFQEMEANARLMASAPSLLEAAIDAWVMLSDIPEEYMDDSMTDTVEKLNTSISKALGYKIGENKEL